MLIHIIMEAVRITSCSDWINPPPFSGRQCWMFSALFVSCMSLLLSPSNDLVVLPSTNRIVLFLNPSHLFSVFMPM